MLISRAFKLGTTSTEAPCRQGHRPTPTHWMSPSQKPNCTSVVRNSLRSVYFEKYILKKNENVSRLDLEKLLHTYNSDLLMVRIMVENLEYERQIEKEHGRIHFEAGPMVEVLSATISPHNAHLSKPLAIYGRIYLEFHHILDGEIRTLDLFNRGPDDPEILGSSRSPTLTSPNDTILASYLCIPLHETKIVVDLWDAHHNVVFVQDSFFVLDATKDDYEQLHLKHIQGTSGSIVVRYLSMLFGILCRVEVQFYRMESNQNKDNIRRVLGVYGEIVARYGKTHGNYVNEECTLFRKSSHEFELVVLGDIMNSKNMRLPRYRLRLPAYASLIVDLNLFDFDTKKPLFKGVVELEPDILLSFEDFRVDDYVMRVCATWEIHEPGRCRVESDSEEEEEEEEEEIETHLVSGTQEEKETNEIKALIVCDTQGEVHVMSDEEEEEEDDDDDDDDDETFCRWSYYNGDLGLYAGSAVEIYSIFIGRPKMVKSLKLYGTIKVDSSFYLFRRDKEDAFDLSEHSRFLPILDGSMMIGFRSTPQMKFNLKDVDGNFFIKGTIEWGEPELHFTPRHNRQLCSVIQGKHGFVSMQYSFFKWAYQANIEVSYKLKKGGYYGVYGSLVAEYSSYDYSTRFRRDLCRIVFFERDEQDMLTLGTMDGKIPLLRTTVVVPGEYNYWTTLNTKANLEMIDLSSGELTRQSLSNVVEIEIGDDVSTSMESEDCVIDIRFKWVTRK